MENEENTLVGLTRPTFNSVVDYLMSKPYGEVSTLMQELQQDSKVITVSPTQEVEPEQTSFESNKGGGEESADE